jgi:glutamyl-tRNA(Gln) amidotransferase subunit E
MPLIEITTAADIIDPEHARDVAEQLGLLLMATKKVKRGLGTIRQDLNISIAKGARIEVKGIQSLSAISKVAELETLRQIGVLEVSEILHKRAKKSDLIHIQSVELSSLLTNGKSKMIQNQLNNKGCIKGVRLPGFHGLLKREQTRIGKDLAVYAGIASGIGGIIHSDEMPGYGLLEQEINDIKEQLQMGSDDAFVLAFGNEPMVDTALTAVLTRATMFFDGGPEEVRRSLPDNTTEYMRPLPGAARMYPETDVPPIRITKERLQRIKLPEKPEEKRKRLATYYHLNEEQIKQLLSTGYEDEFERLGQQFPDLSNVILRTFLNTFAELENEGIPTDEINEQIRIHVFTALSKGSCAKEAVPLLLKFLAQHPATSVGEAIQHCGVRSTGEEEIVQVVRKIVAERKEFVKERGTNALGPLMGLVMKELRGKADGKLISKTLQEEIQKIISS